jgi:hypothetical protein
MPCEKPGQRSIRAGSGLLPPSATLANEADHEQSETAPDEANFYGKRMFTWNGTMKLQQPMHDDVVRDAQRTDCDQRSIDHGIVA